MCMREVYLINRVYKNSDLITWRGFVLRPWKFQASTEYESDYSADGRCCCCCCNWISTLVIHMLHKYIIKSLVTYSNSLDWLSESKLLWRASSQTDQSGLWVLADRHPWLLNTITTLIILDACYCRALPFERGNQTADERQNNRTALNVLGPAHLCVFLWGRHWTLYIKCLNFSKAHMSASCFIQQVR